MNHSFKLHCSLASSQILSVVFARNYAIFFLLFLTDSSEQRAQQVFLWRVMQNTRQGNVLELFWEQESVWVQCLSHKLKPSWNVKCLPTHSTRSNDLVRLHAPSSSSLTNSSSSKNHSNTAGPTAPGRSVSFHPSSDRQWLYTTEAGGCYAKKKKKSPSYAVLCNIK